MAEKASIENIAALLKTGLSLLEQLHVLSQTETLLLDGGDLLQLSAIVEAKENVVARITKNEVELAALLANGEPEGPGHPELVRLKKQALHLIERITEVEQKNKQSLETLRAHLIERSETLKQDRIIQQSYGNLS